MSKEDCANYSVCLKPNADTWVVLRYANAKTAAVLSYEDSMPAEDESCVVVKLDSGVAKVVNVAADEDSNLSISVTEPSNVDPPDPPPPPPRLCFGNCPPFSMVCPEPKEPFCDQDELKCI